MDQPVDAPFYASAFTDGIFSRKSDEEIPGSLISKGTALIVVDMPVVARDETLALVGNGKFMDNWNKVLPLDSSNFPQCPRFKSRCRYQIHGAPHGASWIP